jgi:hypothetical protein|tara:strand:+ start:840 stop:968 length:129 start_codon:yes stop_codon:yes gene_type:complete
VERILDYHQREIKKLETLEEPEKYNLQLHYLVIFEEAKGSLV